MSRLSRKIKRRYKKFFHRPPPGSSPGTILPLVDPNPTRIILTAYDSENIDVRSLHNANQLKKNLGKFPVTWISIIGMQDLELIQAICRELGVHRLTLEDVTNEVQRPKVAYFDNYTYIVIHIPRFDDHGESDVVSIIMGKNFVLTIQDSAQDQTEAIRNRIQKKIGQIRMRGCDYLCYALIDMAIDLYFPMSEFYAQGLDVLESDIVRGGKPVAILDIYNMRSRLNYFHRILWSHNQMISQLIHDPESPFEAECQVYLKDCFEHTLQILEFLENLKENAKTMLDLHLSLQSHRSNEIMKFLTIITATFIPMTFITGLYGMNFNRDLPGNMPELDWAYGYPFALGMMVLAASLMLAFFFRKNWITVATFTRRQEEQDR